MLVRTIPELRTIDAESAGCGQTKKSLDVVDVEAGCGKTS